MRKSLALMVLLILFLGVATTPSRAQDSVKISSVRVDIWPEFDRPAVLVIYHISLAAETSLPAILSLRIPARAEINAVAIVDPNQGLINTDYTQIDSGNWSLLAITVSALEIQVEYYDLLEKEGTTRQVVYEWPGDAAVDIFQVFFQNPVGAANLTINPEPVSNQKDQYNLLNYVSESVSLDAGEKYLLSATYQKEDDQLSIASMPVEPAVPLQETKGQVAWSDVLPWILGALGLVLIVLGLLVLFGFIGGTGWRNRKGKRGRSARHSRQQEKPNGEISTIHCHECGRQAESGDQFCRSCGTRLRRDE